MTGHVPAADTSRRGTHTLRPRSAAPRLGAGRVRGRGQRPPPRRSGRVSTPCPGCTARSTSRCSCCRCAVWCPAALLVISARPRNPIGWLLLGVPLLGSVQNFAGAYGTHAFARPQDGLPLGALAVSVGSSLWPAALFLPLTLMLVRYPSGALPSRRWRWADRAAVAGMVAAAVGLATAPDSVDDWTSAARPVATLPGRSADLLWGVGAVLLLAVTVLVLGNAAVRTAQARGPARAQLLLLALTGAVLVPAAASPWNELFDVSLFLVPIAVAVGVLRYNLLGIEVVVRRALLYGLLTAARRGRLRRGRRAGLARRTARAGARRRRGGAGRRRAAAGAGAAADRRAT